MMGPLTLQSQQQPSTREHHAVWAHPSPQVLYSFTSSSSSSMCRALGGCYKRHINTDPIRKILVFLKHGHHTIPLHHEIPGSQPVPRVSFPYTHTPPFNTKQLSWPGAVCKVKLFLALGLTSWRTPWGKDPRSVLFPYSDQHWHITLPDRGRKAATWQKTPGGENISREEFHKQRVW